VGGLLKTGLPSGKVPGAFTHTRFHSHRKILLLLESAIFHAGFLFSLWAFFVPLTVCSCALVPRSAFCSALCDTQDNGQSTRQERPERQTGIACSRPCDCYRHISHIRGRFGPDASVNFVFYFLFH
jgi:hypothetical protein